ncbi:MAG: dihydrolipoyllysine-residue succinyltransferase, partial [Chloroflexota bacterium]
MIIEVKVPSPGESITEVQLASWLVKDGEVVERDAEIAEIDSDKATLTINASDPGKISIKVQEGETVNVGTVVATIDTSVSAGTKTPDTPPVDQSAVSSSENSKLTGSSDGQSKTTEALNNREKQVSVENSNMKSNASKDSVIVESERPSAEKAHITPLARKIMEEKNLTSDQVVQQVGKKRVGKADVESLQTAVKEAAESPAIQEKPVVSDSEPGKRNTERKKMTTLRLKLSQRLVSVKNETAMLTTFNEVNMSNIMAIRKKYNDKFKEKHGISLGFMSLFTKAVTIALKHFPQVNSIIDGEDLIYHEYVDVGIAVSSPKGLVVPVLRNTESMSLADIELKIKELADKARNNKISLDEMTGGTFTISNGGVFGSLLSTPILNPPQSAILGMHNIVERPIAVNG